MSENKRSCHLAGRCHLRPLAGSRDRALLAVEVGVAQPRRHALRRVAHARRPARRPPRMPLPPPQPPPVPISPHRARVELDDFDAGKLSEVGLDRVAKPIGAAASRKHTSGVARGWGWERRTNRRTRRTGRADCPAARPRRRPCQRRARGGGARRASS